MFYTYYKLPNTSKQPEQQLSFDDLFTATQTIANSPPEHPLAFRTIQITPETIKQKTFDRIAKQCDIFIATYYTHIAAYKTNDMTTLYSTYRIPKRNGGVRIINEPNNELKDLLAHMRLMLESFGILPHTSAYAYVKHRTPKMAVEKHCRAKHNWYLKVDLHDFFGSCTEEFIYNQLTQILFFRILDQLSGYNLKTIIHVCCLNNGLPQGTPISPWLTNQIMLPFDFAMSNWCREHNATYTRYADDMIVSSNSATFLQNTIQKFVELFANTPLKLNEKKTKIVSVYGQSYILGLIVNKDYNATIGHKKKERFRATAHDFITNPEAWTYEMSAKFLGLINYYLQIEPEYFTNVLNKFKEKTNHDLIKELTAKLKSNTTTPINIGQFYSPELIAQIEF